MEQLKQSLHNGLVNITFTKKDGTRREMVATLKMDLIPEASRPKTKPTTTEQDSDFDVEKPVDPDPVINVYSTDSKGWRSFRSSQLVKWWV